MLARVASSVGLRVAQPYGRRLGAEIDFRTACALLELNESLVAGDVDARSRLGALHDVWATAPLSRAIPFANDAITVQVSEMCGHIADMDAGDTPSPALSAGVAALRALRVRGAESSAFAPSIGPSSHLNPRASLALIVKAAAAAAAAKAAGNTRHELAARVGFCTWLGPSQAAVPTAPSGLWLKARAAPGAVIALYSGLTYSAEMLQRADDAGHLGNPRVARPLIPRFDEAVIDVGAVVPGAARNAYALAAHARHPPRGVVPNVMRLQWDIVDAGSAAGGATASDGNGALPFPPALRGYVPNEWGADVSVGAGLYSALEQNIYQKGAVLIALRDLWDEEIFVDQTLNPYADAMGWIPEWARGDWDARREVRRLAGRVSEGTANDVRAHWARQGSGSGAAVKAITTK